VSIWDIYARIWAIDFEFMASAGERPKPVCMVAKELKKGLTIRLWMDDLLSTPSPPYGIGPQDLILAYYASAEMGCHLALGWFLPCAIVDLYAEFRVHTNGRDLSCGSGLVGALTFFGIQAISVLEKEEMRDLVLRGGPYTATESAAILDYCESDVVALEHLFGRMCREIDLPRALLRGRYMKAAARIEWNGVPIDTGILEGLRANWDAVRERLIAEVDKDYGVFEGTTFKVDRFCSWVRAQGICWPVTATGRPALDDDTFSDQALLFPQVRNLRELRVSLAQLRLTDLAVGPDDRNRVLLSAFRAKTGRNQPSNSKFIFGPSVWLRFLIKPPDGYGLAYVDYSQQEFGIAAALSGDAAMMRAYESGDPYLAFGKQAGAIPVEGTKESHGDLREQFKQCSLAVLYGMGEATLAGKIKCSVSRARQLLQLHRTTYPRFWNWSDAAVTTALLEGRIVTAFGWSIMKGSHPNVRALRNFPMQGNGAEMLRLACIFATDAGLEVCAPVHDAILICASISVLTKAVSEAQACMARASSIVLDGFELRSDVKTVRYPDRYSDPRGESMWNTVQRVLHDLKQVPNVVHGGDTDGATVPTRLISL
jgi:hypothetical protein